MDYSRRIGALRRKLNRAGLSGLLVTHPPDVRYLTGFTGSNAAVAVTRFKVRLFTDSRYKTQAAEEVHSAQVEISTGGAAIAAVQWIAVQPGIAQIGFDPAIATVADLARWKAALPARLRRGLLAPLAEPLVESLRVIKDDAELHLMRQAALTGCRIFDHMLAILRPGLPEFEVAAELEHQARLLGAEGMSFETIVASGPRSALPHGRATASPLPRRGFLTLDFGIILKGYCSDMTRTVYLGRPKPEERGAYEAVLEAQQAAVAQAGAGVRCGHVDEAARSVLRSRGLADAFTHSIGAGNFTRLQAGMVITIEPGIYLPGRFGIRIEDMVAVHRTGAEVLTPAPKALIEL